jgi:hypothetical protein
MSGGRRGRIITRASGFESFTQGDEMTALVRIVFGLVVVWTLIAIVETAGGQILPRDTHADHRTATVPAVPTMLAWLAPAR